MRVRGVFASVAPDRPARESVAMPSEVDWLCTRWAGWCRTRRYFGAPPPNLSSVLGELRTARSTAPNTGPGITLSRELALFHRAVLTLDDRHRFVLEAHYLHRWRPTIKVAGAIGVSRVHYYRMLRDGAMQASRALEALLAANGQN